MEFVFSPTPSNSVAESELSGAVKLLRSSYGSREATGAALQLTEPVRPCSGVEVAVDAVEIADVAFPS
jgi:hypothetical protein